MVLSDSNAEDFKSIKLFAGTSHTHYNREFSSCWKDITPIIFQIETNYFYFDVTASFSYSHFESKSPQITNFHSARADLLISYPVPVFNFAQLNLGVKAGNFFMFFDNENKYAGRESELFTAADISIQTKIVKNLLAKISYEYGMVFTLRRITCSQISLAIGYAFNTPHIIKEFLK